MPLNYKKLPMEISGLSLCKPCDSIEEIRDPTPQLNPWIFKLETASHSIRVIELFNRHHRKATYPPVNRLFLINLVS